MNTRLIINTTFDDDIRSQLVFSDADKVRLNTEDKSSTKIQLKATAGSYPLDTDIFVETPIVYPNAVQQWLGFEAIVVEDPITGLIPTGLEVKFKVKTTAGNYWWNGTTWAIALANEWNSELEINNNIHTLPIQTIGNRGIGFVVNLITTNPSLTPEVKQLKLLGSFEIDFLEDLVYDSVIRKLNTQLRSTSIVVFPTADSISEIDLNTVLENKGYNVTGIKKVINLTDDPMKLTNLFDTYTQGAARQDGFTFELGTVSFMTPIDANKLVEVTFEYVPEIIVNTGVDYFEVPAFPSIVFESIEEAFIPGFSIKDTNNFPGDYIRNKANLTAVQECAPEQRVIRFSYALFTGSQLDQMRLTEDFKAFLSQNKAITSYGLGHQYDVNIVNDLSTKRNQKVNSVSDTNAATGAFDVLGVMFFNKPSKDAFLVGPGQFQVATSLQ